MITSLVGLFSLNLCSKILVYNSREIGIAPTKNNLSEVTNQVLNQTNSVGNSYIPANINLVTDSENSVTAKSEIVASKNLLYAPTKGFNVIIYLRYVTATKTYMPIGYTILDDIIGAINLDDTESIYPTKTTLNFSTTVGGKSSSETISDGKTIGDLIDKQQKKSFSKYTEGNLYSSYARLSDIGSLGGYLSDKRLTNAGQLFIGKLDLSGIMGDIEKKKFWFGYSPDDCPMLIISPGEEDSSNFSSLMYNFDHTGPRIYQYDNVPKRYLNPDYYGDLFRTGSFAIELQETDQEYKYITHSVNLESTNSDGIDDPINDDGLINLWSAYPEYFKSSFSSANDLSRAIPEVSDLVLLPNIFIQSGGTIKIIVKIGQWFLFDLERYGCWTLVNDRTAIILERGSEFHAINNKAVLVRDSSGELYLIESPGLFGTPTMVNLLLSTYPYSKIIRMFNPGGELINERSLFSGSLKKFRRKSVIKNSEYLKIIGAIQGFIFYINSSDRTIDYL